MHVLAHRPLAVRPLRLLAVAAIVALGLGLGAASVRADGDPASDVLAFQSLFLPFDVPFTGERQLEGELAAAARAGFPIRVALINSVTDLGTVTALWGEPSHYAAYLGSELSIVFHGQVLVVMPNGFGLYASHEPPAGEVRALEALPAAGRGADLTRGAIAAVRRLAQGAGVRLPGVIAAAPAPAPAAAPGSGDAGPLTAFVAGLIAIALAWGASLRARPLQLRRGSGST